MQPVHDPSSGDAQVVFKFKVVSSSFDAKQAIDQIALLIKCAKKGSLFWTRRRGIGKMNGTIHLNSNRRKSAGQMWLMT
jgi:hypothetical protein